MCHHERGTNLLAMTCIESDDDFIHEGDIELPREIQKALLSKFMNLNDV